MELSLKQILCISFLFLKMHEKTLPFFNSVQTNFIIVEEIVAELLMSSGSWSVLSE